MAHRMSDTGRIPQAKALAIQALRALGASATAIRSVESVDVVDDGLTPCEWAFVGLQTERGHAAGSWGWTTLARAMGEADDLSL